MSGYIAVSSGDESSLQAAVASTGPVSVAVDASSNAFRVCTCTEHSACDLMVVVVRTEWVYTAVSFLIQYYYSGVYDSSRCSSYDINHAMVVTGFGTYGSSDYWLVKNR